MQWSFCPSIPLAAIYTVIFGILTFSHLFQAILYRKRFCWVICMASAWETTGLTFRLLGALHPTKQTYVIVSQVFVLLAPLWINAFAYMVTGRMVYYWLPDKKVWMIKARTLSVWFVWLDVGTFLVQATGGSMLDGTDPKSIQMGLDICKCRSNSNRFLLCG